MIRRIVLLLFMASLLALPVIFLAQDSPALDLDKKMIAFEKDHSEVMQNLEYLTDMIGPRLTGSDRLKKANDWTLKRFEEYGCTDGHLENWSFGLGWERISATGRIVEPNGLPLTIASYGWAPSTNGTVTGKLVYVNIQKEEDFDKYRGQLRGKFIIQRPPADLSRPFGGPPDQQQERRRNAAGRPGTPPAGPGQPPTADGQPAPSRPNFEQMRQLREKITQFFKDEGVLVVIVDSAKEHSLLNMTGLGGRDPKTAVLPSVFTTHENYTMLWRLLEKKQKVVLEMNIQNRFTAQPLDAYNTVAEIRGTEKPDEVVIVGGHLDSWDLGTGTTDNGTGSMAALEAAHILNAVGAKPRRTIRFVLFTGEEEGLLGSKAYAEAHKAEADKISAVLIMDTGTGHFNGISMQGREDLRPVMASVLAPLNDLGVRDINLRNQGGTDHLSFLPLGVPGFAFYQDPAEYGKTHHSQSDTFDKAKSDDLIQASTSLAVAAFNIAELPTLMTHKMSPAAPAQPNAPRAGNPQ
ncbi:MAG: M20/M25/M40 family metallo-hydrolase [Acidobacteriia bacterium]|nr:M20/M25/M40 family metallo-hydrolase [Terriglobia bacterium]